MKTLTTSLPRPAIALLGLALLSGSASAQNWLRDDHTDDHSERLLSHPDGRLIDVSRDEDTGDLRLRTLNHDGTTLTALHIEPIFGGTAEPDDAALLPDGDLIVVGGFFEEDSSTPLPWIGRMDPATGTPDWHVTIDQPGFDLRQVAVADDAIYAAGVRPNLDDLMLVKVDMDGNLLWHLQGGMNGNDYLNEIVVTPDQDPVIAFLDDDGYSHIVRFDADGNQLWHRFYDTFTARAMVISDSGDIWVGGTSSNDQIAILAISLTSSTLWSTEYTSYPGYTISMERDPQGGVMIAGDRVPGDYRAALLSIDADGGVRWNRMYDYAGGYFAQGIQGVAHVDQRGWVIRCHTELDGYLLAVDPAGEIDMLCVTPTTLVTSETTLSVGPDEPPSFSMSAIPADDDPLLLQPFEISNPFFLTCGDPCNATAMDLGSGLAGSGGIIPELEGFSGACIGAPHPRIELTKGLGGSLAFFGYSIGTQTIPFYGGSVYLDPQNLWFLPIVLDGTPGQAGAGTWSLEVTNDLSGYFDLSIATQVFIFDPLAVQGWSFSPAVLLHID